MRASTHMSFGILSLLSIGLLISRPATLTAAVFATIGSWLPDIDTEKSTIGRIFHPPAAYLERRFGHRGATHSLLALVGLCALTAPLIAVNRLWWTAIVTGYLSHIFLDTLNKQGVQLFYPSTIRAVMPRNPDWRVTAGSKTERGLLVVFSILALLLWPVNQTGLFPALHALLKDTQSAIADYRGWENSYRVFVDVEGTFNISQQPITARFEVIGIENANSLAVYDAHDDLLYTVGTDQNANIYPKRVICKKGEPISVTAKKVHLENELLGNLSAYIPNDGLTFIKGTLKTTDPVLLPQDPQTAAAIRPGNNEIELQYAQQKDLEPIDVRTIFAISGDFYLRTIRPAGTKSAVKRPPPPPDIKRKPQASYTTEMYIHDVRQAQEIRVKAGQEIRTGELIAQLHDPMADRRQLEKQRLEKQMKLLKARADPVSALLLTETRQRLNAIEAEREKHRIYSSVNGRVLLVRTHTIHNESKTIVIRLLVHEP